MAAEVIPFPWTAPRPAERQAEPARVLILPVIRIERYDADADQSTLDRELRAVSSAIAEDR